VLERTDRIALAVSDAEEACESYRVIFDAEVVGDAKDAEAGARRVTLQWGESQVEIYEPTAEGPAADFIRAGRRGLFAGGFTSPDPAAVAGRLEAAGIRVHEQGAERFCVWPGDLDGVGVILSKTVERERVGLADKIWQITYAVPDLEAAIERYSDLFGLGACFTNRYESDPFGYLGAITWFDARDRAPLDSLEYLEPNDPSKNVARFVGRHGAGVYMASIEAQPDAIAEMQRRVEATGGGWVGRETGFIQPRRLSGLLVGIVDFEGWNAQRPLP
jgi:catechol 2,3-dioxygenase-like lactoylglutathione lyase family enzyme